MGRSKYNWYNNAVHLIRRYPEICRRKRALQEQNIIADYSGMPHSGNAGRNTENVAVKELSPVDEAAYDVITSAIETMSLLAHGEEILRIVDMVDWKRSHTIYGAAQVMYMHHNTAKAYRKEFIKAVAIASCWLE